MTIRIRTHEFPRRRAGLAAAWPLLGCSLMALCGAPALAGPASPAPFTLQQPDGQEIVARQQGDERINWVETQGGYTIAQDQDGVWRYVSGFQAAGTGASQGPVLSDVPAQDPPPAGVPRHLHPAITPPPASNVAPASTPRSGLSARTTTLAATVPPRVLLILASFNNQPGTFGQPLWATGFLDSVVDYYSRASYGTVNMQPAYEDDTALGGGAAANNGVIGWINISAPLAALEQKLKLPDQTGNHPSPGKDPTRDQYTRLIAKVAMQAAGQYMNYAQYDYDLDGQVTADELAVVIVVAGNEASSNAPEPYVWGQASDLVPASDDGALVLDGKTLGVGAIRSGVGPLLRTSGFAVVGEKFASASPPYYVQGAIGLTVHELAHQIFGLPDLYEVSPSLCPDNLPSSGVGAWSIMGSGSWGARLGEVGGTTPVLPDAWSKWQLGWVQPLGRDRAVLTGAGEATATAYNTVYYVPTNGAITEYFLVENRQNQGYDQGLQSKAPGFNGGVAIWHIDDSIPCQNNDCNSRAINPHPRVYLEAGARTCISNAAEADQSDLFINGFGSRTVLSADTLPTNSKLWNGASKGAASGVSILDIFQSTITRQIRVRATR